MSEYKRFDEKVWASFGKKLLPKDKGSERCLEEQRKFLAACQSGKDDFLKYLEHKGLLDNAVGDDTVHFTYQFTEKEFIYPPDDTQKKIWEAFEILPDEITCKCGFWAYVIIEMVKSGQIRPFFLASELNGADNTGSYMIDNALKSSDASKIDSCVRRILRSMCNPEPRGKRIVFNDFHLGKAYWRWQWADKMSSIMKRDLILKVLNEKYYAEFSARMHTGKTYIGSENIFGGLLLFLEKNRKIGSPKLQQIIERIKYLSVWKAIEAQTPKLNQKEIQEIADSLG